MNVSGPFHVLESKLTLYCEQLDVAPFLVRTTLKMLSCRPTGSSIVATPEAAHGGYVTVDAPPLGYWIAGSGYPVLNGIYSRAPTDAEDALCYRNIDTDASLSFITQGWLLCLPASLGGTDCFLQMSTQRLMVNSCGWMAIDSPDTDPLAEPPDEVVALLDEGALQHLIGAKRAHEARLRRARLLLGSSSEARSGSWWLVVHSPAVVVRESPSIEARSLGLKLQGERVLATESRGPWLKVHAPLFDVESGWMLVHGAELSLVSAVCYIPVT